MFLNLTPHSIVLPNATIEPCGVVARCEEESTREGEIDGVEIITRKYGKVTGLPDWELGTFLIVSHMCRIALPDRVDLLSPGTVTRDTEGNITGCLDLIANEILFG